MIWLSLVECSHLNFSLLELTILDGFGAYLRDFCLCGTKVYLLVQGVYRKVHIVGW